MSDFYSYTLDSVPFNDPIIGIDSLTRTIERYWLNTDIENSLRKKCESALTFTGEAASYLCALFANTFCTKTNIVIYAGDGSVFFEGTLYGYMGTYNVTRNTFETQIKDNSWSSLIFDRSENDFYTRSIKSFDCSVSITRLTEIETDFFDIDGNYTFTNRKGFDVLALLQKQIEHLSNGQMTLTSNYLTNNRYGIYAGYSLNNQANKQHFKLSFAELYDNLRKMFNLYIVIDGNNIILEPESDNEVFDTSLSEILEFNELPFDTTEEIDIDRLVTSVTVGNQNIQENASNDTTEYLPLDDKFNQIKYENCSCTSIKDNRLDLTYSLISDSNTILDCIINGTNDDKLFIVKLNDIDLSKTARYVVIPTVIWYYNDTLRNSNVLERWNKYIGSCLYIARGNDNGFIANGRTDPNDLFAANTITAGSSLCEIKITYPDYELDPFSRFSQNSGGKACDTPTVLNNFTSYTVLQSGTYAFEAARTFLYVAGGSGSMSVSFIIFIYEDSTMSVLLYTYVSNYNIDIDAPGGEFDMDVITDALDLSPGNFVVVQTNFITTDVSIGGVLYSGYFRSADEVLACINQNEPENTLPYLISFNSELCNSDFDLIDNNKSRKIKVNGIDCFIKEVNQSIKNTASFVLLANQSICKCSENGS